MLRKCFLCVAMCLLVLAGVQAWAQCPEGSWQERDFCVGEGDSGIKIFLYTGSGGDILVPQLNMYGGVVEIGDSAFQGCTGLKSVFLHENITIIGDSAFGDCPSLSAAYFQGDAPTMGTGVFDGSSPDFGVCYLGEAANFESPLWNGYPAEVCSHPSRCRINWTIWAPIEGGTNHGSFPTAEESRTQQAALDTFLFLFGPTPEWDGQCYSKRPSQVCVNGYLSPEPTFVDGSWNVVCKACEYDSDCSEGSECVDGECIPDNPPELGAGPFVAAGHWPLLSSSSESPTYFKQNRSLAWNFSDDFASCSEDCTHSAEYQVLGTETWTSLSVSIDAANGIAYAELPITELQNATTYAFRFAVTDCAGQTTQSEEYYFRVATSDAPPVITAGPYLAAGSWPLLPILGASPVTLKKNYYAFWTFSDDYAICSGLCTHRARYKKVGDTEWTLLAVSTDSEGTDYAYTMLPVEELDEGTYHFYFDVRDCKGQRTYAPNVYTFKVAH